MDVVKEEVGVSEENAEDRNRWRQMIHCGNPLREQPKSKEDLTEAKIIC